MSETNQNRRVVITGLGMLAPEGIGRAEFEAHVREGRTGLSVVDKMPLTSQAGHAGGEVKGFTEETAKKVYLKPYRKHIKVMGRDVQLGVAAAILALQDAGLDKVDRVPERVGVEFGANLMYSTPAYLFDPCTACADEQEPTFHHERWGSEGMAKMEPLWMLKYLPNMPACHVGIFTDSRGPNNSITQDEVSGGLALGEAAAIIRRGRADIMITGSTGLRLHPLKAIHAELWDEIASRPDDPTHAVRPFDINRNGGAIAEAACCLILEEDAYARERGADILGELLSTGSSCVGSPNGQADIRTALANAMRSALRSANLSPADIGHINAQGNATRDGDAAEAQAIHDVFGELGSQVPVVGLKGYHGNPGASGGMLELSVSLLFLKEGLIPFTLNTEQPDPDLNLDVVIREPRPTDNKIVMKLTYTKIGQASAVIVRGE